jgi:hypothetical protein
MWRECGEGSGVVGDGGIEDRRWTNGCRGNICHLLRRKRGGGWTVATVHPLGGGDAHEHGVAPAPMSKASRW